MSNLLPIDDWAQVNEVTDSVDKRLGYQNYLINNFVDKEGYTPEVANSILTSTVVGLRKDGLTEEQVTQALAHKDYTDDQKFGIVFRSGVANNEDKAVLSEFNAYANVAAKGNHTPDFLQRVEDMRASVKPLVDKYYEEGVKSIGVVEQVPFVRTVDDEGNTKVIANPSAVGKSFKDAFKESVDAGMILAQDAPLALGLHATDDAGVHGFQHNNVQMAMTSIAELDKFHSEGGEDDSLAFDGDIYNYAKQRIVDHLVGGGSIDDEEIAQPVSTITNHVASFDKDLANTPPEDFKAAIEFNLGNAAMLSGAFEFDDTAPSNNIRKFGYGYEALHSSTLANKASFEAAVADLPKADQKRLGIYREAVREGLYDSNDKALSRSYMADDWATFKAAGKAEGVSNADILDAFLENEERYSYYQNEVAGLVGNSIPESVTDIVWGIGAAFDSESARENLLENHRDRQAKRKVAELFGEKVGMEIDLGAMVAPVAADIAATALITAKTAGLGTAAYLGTRAAGKGIIRGMIGSAFKVGARETTEQAAKRLVADKVVKSVGSGSAEDTAKLAIESYAKIASGATSPTLFVTSATRSGTMTYANIYDVLSHSEEGKKMTDQERHQKALTGGLVAGTITGAIVYGFQKSGMGGVEGFLLNRATGRDVRKIFDTLSKRKAALTDDEFGTQLSKVLSQGFKKFSEAVGPRQGTLKTVSKGFKDEAIEEGLDEYINTIVENVVTNEDISFSDLVHQAGLGAFYGGIFGGAVSGIQRAGASIGTASERQAEVLTSLSGNITASLKESGSPLTGEVVKKKLAEVVLSPAAAREATTETPTEATTETPVEATTETPVEATTETPVEATTETPTEATTETPTEATTETPVEAPVEIPTETPVEAPVAEAEPIEEENFYETATPEDVKAAVDKVKAERDRGEPKNENEAKAQELLISEGVSPQQVKEATKEKHAANPADDNEVFAPEDTIEALNKIKEEATEAAIEGGFPLPVSSNRYGYSTMTRAQNKEESKKIKEGIEKQYPPLGKKELASVYGVGEESIIRPKDKKYFISTESNTVLNNNDPVAVAQALSDGRKVTSSNEIESPNPSIKVGGEIVIDVTKSDVNGDPVSAVVIDRPRPKTDSAQQSTFVKRAQMAALLFSSGKGSEVKIETRNAGFGDEGTTTGSILNGTKTLGEAEEDLTAWLRSSEGERTFAAYKDSEGRTITETGMSEFMAEAFNALKTQALRKRLEPFLEITPREDGKGQTYTVKEGSEQQVIESLLETIDTKLLSDFKKSETPVKVGKLKLDLLEASNTDAQILASYLYHTTGGKGEGSIKRPSKDELEAARVIGKIGGKYKAREARGGVKSWEISMIPLVVNNILSNTYTQDVGEARFPNFLFMKQRARDMSRDKASAVVAVDPTGFNESPAPTLQDFDSANVEEILNGATKKAVLYVEYLSSENEQRAPLSQLVKLLTGVTAKPEEVNYNHYLQMIAEQRKFLIGDIVRDFETTQAINELVDSLTDESALPLMMLGAGTKDRGDLSLLADRLREFIIEVESPNLLISAENVLAARSENLAVMEALGLQDGDAQSFIDAIAKISKESDNPMFRMVAKYILDSGKALPTFEFRIISDRKARYAGLYTRDTEGVRTITLNTDSIAFTNMEGTVLHEAIHAITEEIISSDRSKLTPRQRAGIQKLEKLRKQILQEHQASVSKGGSTSYEVDTALSNMDEFVAMMFTSSTLMQRIQGLPPKGLVQRFINAVLDLFNIGPKAKAREAFSDLVDITNVDPLSTSDLGLFDAHLEAAILSSQRPSVKAKAAMSKMMQDTIARSNQKGTPSLDGMDSGDTFTYQQSRDLNKIIDQVAAETIPAGVELVVVDQAADAPEAFAPNPDSASVATIVEKDGVPTPVIFINREGAVLALQKAGSVDGVHAKMILEAQFTEELAHAAEFKTLTIEELDVVLSSLPDSELIDAVDSYTSDRAAANALKTAIENGDMDAKRAALGEMLRMKTQMITRGFTTEQDIAFYASQPSFARVMLRYLAGMFRRLYAKYNLKKNNGEISLAVNRISDEIRLLKSGVAGGATVMRFDPNQPDATITELNRRFTATFGEDSEVNESTTLEQVYERHPHLRLVEIPLGIYDTTKGYTKNAGLQKLLRGELDPRVADINRQATGLSNAIESKMNSTMRFLMGEIEKNPDLDDTLVADYLGRPTDIDVTDAEIEGFTATYRERLYRETAESYDRDETRSKEQKEADRELAYKEEVTDKIEAVKQTRKLALRERRDRAAAKIESISPEALKHMRDLREQLDNLSIVFAEVFDTDGELRAVIDRNLGIYVVRAYRAFTEEGYMDRLMMLAGGDASAADAQMVKNYEAVVNLFSEQYVKTSASKEARNLREQGQKADADKLKEEAMDRLESIEGQKEIRNAIQNYLQSLDRSYSIDSTFRLTPSVSRSVVDNIRARKVIPEPIRDLLGQYADEDVVANLQRSFQAINKSLTKETFIRNLVTLGSQSDTKFVYSTADLKRLDSEGRMPTGVFVNLKTGNPYSTGADPSKLVNDEVEAKYSVSADYYVDVELFKNIQSQFRPQAKASDLSADKQVVESAVTVARSLTGAALAAKTLGSIGFYFRNIVGNVAYFAPMQGMSPLTAIKNMGVIRKGFRTSSAEFAAISDYEAKLIAHNVLGNDISSSMIREILEGNFEPSKAEEEMNILIKMAKKLAKIGTNTKAYKKLETHIYQRSMALSQLVDSFYKIAYFENELKTLKEARDYEINNNVAGGGYATLSTFELEARAAKTVGETTQSYAHRYEMVKYASSKFGYLLAPFLGFKSDVIRITFATPKIAYSEIKSENPIIRNRGLKRMSGFTFVTAGMAMAIPTALRMMMGVFEEEDEYYRKGVPDYAKDSTFIYKKTEGDKLRAYDITYLNPLSYITDAALRFAEEVAKGDPINGVMRAIRMIGSEFTQDQIFGSAVADVLNNSDNITGDKIYDEKEGASAVFKALKYIWLSSFEPRTFKAAREAGVAAFGDVPEDPEKLPFAILSQEFHPVRGRNVEPDVTFSRYITTIKGDLSRARSEVNKLKSKASLTEGDIRKVVRDYVEADRAYTQKLRNGLRAGSRFKLTAGQARDVFSTKQVTKEDQIDVRQGVHSKKFPWKSVFESLQGHPSQIERMEIALDEFNKLPIRTELD